MVVLKPDTERSENTRRTRRLAVWSSARPPGAYKRLYRRELPSLSRRLRFRFPWLHRPQSRRGLPDRCSRCRRPSSGPLTHQHHRCRRPPGGGHLGATTTTLDRWHMVTVAALAELCDYLDTKDPAIRGDAYSTWCAFSLRPRSADGCPATRPAGQCRHLPRLIVEWCACEWSGTVIVSRRVHASRPRASPHAAAIAAVLPHQRARRSRSRVSALALMLATDGEGCSLVGGAS